MAEVTKILIIFSIVYIRSAKPYKIIWDNSVDFDFNDFNPNVRTDEVRMPNWFFIFPGTKWCGVGNIADNEDDLGVQRDTDKCCRNHDNCPDIINAYETKYNLTNPSFYTRLNCNCDDEFHKCLKSVNTITSTQVGHLYFTALGTKCYKNEHLIAGCLKYTYFPKRKCIEYTFNISEDEEYQWFDVPNY